MSPQNVLCFRPPNKSLRWEAISGRLCGQVRTKLTTLWDNRAVAPQRTERETAGIQEVT